MSNYDYLVMLKRRENIIVTKTEAFADRIVKMCKCIFKRKTGDKDMINQIYRSGTSIGANVAEGQYAQSKADFLTKMTIALKEANETRYWLGRLRSGEVLTDKEYESIKVDVEEIIRLLTSITGTVKGV